MVLAVYPGSFDPPTVAHLAVATAALAHADEVRFVLSQVALGKEERQGRPAVEARRQVLERSFADKPRLSVTVTAARLVVDIAEAMSADAVVVGADKWAQICAPAWYGGSSRARDSALARLPLVLLAPRGVAGRVDGDGPAGGPGAHRRGVVALDVGAAHLNVSSTRARAGDGHLMLPEARTSGLWP